MFALCAPANQAYEQRQHFFSDYLSAILCCDHTVVKVCKNHLVRVRKVSYFGLKYLVGKYPDISVKILCFKLSQSDIWQWSAAWQRSLLAVMPIPTPALSNIDKSHNIHVVWTMPSDIVEILLRLIWNAQIQCIHGLEKRTTAACLLATFVGLSDWILNCFSVSTCSHDYSMHYHNFYFGKCKFEVWSISLAPLGPSPVVHPRPGASCWNGAPPWPAEEERASCHGQAGWELGRPAVAQELFPLISTSFICPPPSSPLHPSLLPFSSSLCQWTSTLSMLSSTVPSQLWQSKWHLFVSSLSSSKTLRV